MRAWGNRGVVGASWRRRRSVGAVIAIVAVALTIVAVSVGGTVDSVTLQSPKNNSASVVSDGVAPGALIEANVTITLSNNETLDRILVTHDGTSQCVDVSNATGDNNGDDRQPNRHSSPPAECRVRPTSPCDRTTRATAARTRSGTPRRPHSLFSPRQRTSISQDPAPA